jgi:hypothetical protein
VIPKTVIAPKYIPAPIRQRWFAADQDAAEPSESITPQQKKAAVEHEECPPDDFPDEEPEDGDPEQKVVVSRGFGMEL